MSVAKHKRNPILLLERAEQEARSSVRKKERMVYLQIGQILNADETDSTWGQDLARTQDYGIAEGSILLTKS